MDSGEPLERGARGGLSGPVTLSRAVTYGLWLERAGSTAPLTPYVCMNCITFTFSLRSHSQVKMRGRCAKLLILKAFYSLYLYTFYFKVSR